jgi:succinoglycan biosynthesis protein ExoA
LERSRLLNEEFPNVTVIMPVRNEAGFIDRSLGAVLAQDYAHHKMEVVIADGMSSDDTREVIARLTRDQDISVSVLDNPDRIVPTGMNVAIQRANGEVIIRVDGHAVLQPNYITLCVESLMATGLDCVGGVVESRGIGYIGEAIAVVMSSAFGVGASGFRTLSNTASPMLTDTVPFGAFRRDVFERIGLFNEKMVRHQDYEFNYRLRRHGGRIMLLPTARAIYFVRSTLSGVLKQYWQYGLWKGSFIRAYPDSLKLRHLAPPLFVLVLVCSGILEMFSWVGGAVLASSLGAYVMFIIAALVSLRKRGKIKYLPILPIIFACIHLSWGLGVWIGLLWPKPIRPESKSAGEDSVRPGAAKVDGARSRLKL